MAWTKVGETTFIQSNDDAGEASDDHTLPGSPAEGDIVIVAIACDDSLVTEGGGVTTSDYTTIAKTASAAPGDHIAWKIMGATPDTVVAVQRSNTQKQAGVIQIWRGVDQVTPIDATPVTASNTTGMPDAGSFSTVTAGALRIIIGILDDDDAASGSSAPTGYTNFVAGDTGQASSVAGATALIASKEEASPGAGDPAAFGGTGSDAWRAYHFALRPASGVSSATASASGIATVAATSAATKASTAAASGTATALGVGRSTAAAVGSSAGVATAAAVGAGLSSGAGASAGAATVSGVGAAVGTGVGASSGVATVSGVGRSTAAVAASASGVASVAGVGASTAASVAASAGVGVATGVGRSTAASVAASAGIATALAVTSGSVLASAAQTLANLSMSSASKLKIKAQA
jgi:hypothetical protein